MTLNYDMYAEDSRWSKICKRGDDEMLSIDYIFNSFKLAPIIVVATDSDGKIRSYATVGLKEFDGKKHLYIDVLCSCLNEQGYCPTETYVSRGPGGADIISVLLFIIVSLKTPTKYEGIILNSLLGVTEEIYESLGFKKYEKNEVENLTTMHYNLSKKPELVRKLRERVEKNEGKFHFDISFLREKKRKREISTEYNKSTDRLRHARNARLASKRAIARSSVFVSRRSTASRWSPRCPSASAMRWTHLRRWPNTGRTPPGGTARRRSCGGRAARACRRGAAGSRCAR